MVEPDTIIDGRYKVVSRVGSGGMADVYLAEDQLLGRKVAVKILHHHFAEDQEFVERFRREASSAAALSHQNIVGIFDRGEWQGTYYIAMEYVAGRSLKTIVREQGALEPALAIDIVVQILRAARRICTTMSIAVAGSSAPCSRTIIFSERPATYSIAM